MHMRAWLTPKPVLILMMLATSCVDAWAARVEGLYAAEVALSRGSTSALPDVFEVALGKVLVKVTGRRDVTGDQEVINQFGDASVLVQQYRIDPGDKVWVLFDRVGIRRILDRLGLPVWGDERPSTLVWLVMDAGEGQREMLAADSTFEASAAGLAPLQVSRIAMMENSVRETLRGAADDRGLPIFLPLVDTKELMSISISAVWGGFAESLMEASTRYGADAVLVGRAHLSPGRPPEVRWTLMLEKERFDWISDIAGGPNELADLFAARLATSIGEARQILLQVQGVESLDDYGRVSTYLSALNLVENFSVDRVSGSDVTFGLSVRGDVDRLMRTIALRRVLQIVDERSQVSIVDGGMPDIGVQRLRYRLIPEL